MKKHLSRITKSALIIYFFCTNGQLLAATVKVPHSHRAYQGGQVHMFGDDKMPDIVPLTAVKLNVEIVNSTGATPLKGHLTISTAQTLTLSKVFKH